MVGLGSAFSTNIWADVHLLPGKTYFDTMDYVSNNIMLPVGGMLIALFSGWVLDRKIREEQLGLSEGWMKVWQVLVRFVSPLAVLVVFVMTFV